MKIIKTLAVMALALCVVACRDEVAIEAFTKDHYVFPVVRYQQAVAIQYHSPDAVIALDKQAHSWQLAAPIAYPAEASLVDVLLQTVHHLEIGKQLHIDAHQLAQLGLAENNRERLIIDYASGDRVELRLGKIEYARDKAELALLGDGYSARRYIRVKKQVQGVDTDHVYWVGNAFMQFPSQPDLWAAYQFIRLPQVAELSLFINGEPHLQLKRNEAFGALSAPKGQAIPVQGAQATACFEQFLDLGIHYGVGAPRTADDPVWGADESILEVKDFMGGHYRFHIGMSKAPTAHELRSASLMSSLTQSDKVPARIPMTVTQLAQPKPQTAIEQWLVASNRQRLADLDNRIVYASVDDVVCLPSLGALL